MTSSSPEPLKINVRNIISLFENHTVRPVTNEQSKLLQRAKSMGNLSKKPIYKSPERITASTSKIPSTSETIQLKNQIDNLHTNLRSYREYDKETHIKLQNEIFAILTHVISIESSDDEFLSKRSDLLEEIKMLNKTLTLRLPGPEINNNNINITNTTKASSGSSSEFKANSGNDNVIDGPIPSVQKLKDLFEKKGSESDGLNVISVKPKTPNLRRAKSLYTSPSDYKYIPYFGTTDDNNPNNNNNNNNNNNHVDDDGDDAASNASERVVHNASIIKRSASLKIENLRAYFEQKQPEVIVTDADDDDDKSNSSVISQEESLHNGSIDNGDGDDEEQEQHSSLVVDDE